MHPLQPHETKLKGGVATFDGYHMLTDPVCVRIDWLTLNNLEKISSLPEQTVTLFRDPADGRLWERTYPHRTPDSPGDGPPHLKVISEAEARERHSF